MDDQADNEDDGNRRSVVIALVAVVLLGTISYFLAHELSASARLQDCVLSGRTNCAPIETPR